MLFALHTLYSKFSKDDLMKKHVMKVKTKMKTYIVVLD